MGPLLVVLVTELVEQGLEFSDRGGLDGLAPQPVLQCLLEAFDLAAGRGVVRSGVLLGDVEPVEGFLQGGFPTAAAFASEPDRVNRPGVSGDFLKRSAQRFAGLFCERSTPPQARRVGCRRSTRTGADG